MAEFDLTENGLYFGLASSTQVVVEGLSFALWAFFFFSLSAKRELYLNPRQARTLDKDIRYKHISYYYEHHCRHRHTCPPSFDSYCWHNPKCTWLYRKGCLRMGTTSERVAPLPPSNSGSN